MKILLYSNYPLSLDNTKGGVETAIINLLDGFRQMQDTKFDIITHSSKITKVITKDYNENIKIIYLPFKLKFEILDYFFNRKTLSEFICKSNPDIIHIHISGPFILRFIFMKKNNIVITQHGIFVEESKYVFGLKNKLKYMLKIFTEKCIFPKFHNYIFISKYNKLLFPGSLTNKKYVIIPNAISSNYYNLFPNLIVRDRLLYIGTISHRKNILLLIEVLKLLKTEGIEYYLDVIGDFIDVGYKNKVLKLVNSYNLTENICFLGWKTQTEILSLLPNYSFYILPSFQETLPMSIGEVMAAGLIPICSNTGGNNELIDDKINGFLFNPNDPNELKSILKDIRYNNYDIPIMSVKAKTKAYLTNHCELIANKTLKFYKKVLD